MRVNASTRFHAVLLVPVLAALPVIALLLRPQPLPEVLAGLGFAQLRTLLELVSMLICGAVAAVAWSARELEVPHGVKVLGSACAGALVLDMAHVLSYPGMPDLLGVNTASRTTALCIASRLLIGLALLRVAVLSWRLDHVARRGWRLPAGVAGYVLLVLAWVFVFGAPDTVPVTAVEGSDLAFAKFASHSFLVGLFLVASVLFARCLYAPRPLDAKSLLYASLLMAIGEVMLALSARSSYLAITAGHLYEVLGFWMVYRSIVADSIRAPHQRLVHSRQRLERNEHELRTIIDSIPAMVAFIDTEQRYHFVNRNYQRWLGLKPEDMLGRTALEVYGEKPYGALRPHIERALSGQTFAVDHRIGGVEFGRGRWLNIMYMPKIDTDGRVSGVYILSSDITEVMVAEHRALFLAEHDELTTLPNRAAFQAAVGKALEHRTRELKPPDGSQGESRSAEHVGASSQFAVIFVDVDRFKVINDTLGHAAGDQLLQALATRMRHVVRGQDLVARMGGDEMCLLLHDVRDAAHASEIAERILGALRAPIELRPGLQHHVTVSAGIAIFPQDGTNVETLLRHADIAMYRAKAAGRDGFALFGAHDGGPAEARLNLELELRTAIDAQQLVLHYQPRVDMATDRPAGMEALVRWQHPQRGLLAPGHFIDIAEETGLIVPIGAWVLSQAGQALKRLQAAGVVGLTMSVNVSARQFKNPKLVDEVAGMLQLAGCEPHQIELELTESAVMDQPDLAEATMRRLKALGVRLAMDDFGTGYSSLGALKRFPVDCVKIDRSFVNDLPGDAGDAALTRAIIAMGHSLGLHVVAEGVERQDQLEFLRREGCDEYQGYYFAKPMNEADLTALLALAPEAVLAAHG